MQNSDQIPHRRGIFVRMGICALNIIQPGLGLVRLSQFRTAIAFYGGIFSTFAGVTLAYYIVDDMTFQAFATIISVALVVIFLLHLGSIALTWNYSRHKENAPQWWSRWYGLVLIILAFGAAVSAAPRLWMARYRNFYLPAESMSPTLEKGDRFLGKMSDLRQLKHGDLLIVKVGQSEYVKRLVALPGESIAMKGGIIFLNGKAVPQTMVKSEPDMEPGGTGVITLLSERLSGEMSPHRVYDAGPTSQDEIPEIRLGADQYFFLGDNRDLSADSRFGLEFGGTGLVSRDRIIGRALFRYWRKGSGISVQPL